MVRWSDLRDGVAEADLGGAQCCCYVLWCKYFGYCVHVLNHVTVPVTFKVTGKHSPRTQTHGVHVGEIFIGYGFFMCINFMKGA